MSYRIMQILVLWENCLVATLSVLVSFCKAFIAEILLVDVLYFSCYNINSLVVVFVDW